VDTFTKPLADGRTAYVTPLLTAFGDVSFEAVDQDGQRLADGWLYEATARGIREDERPAGCTHLIPAWPSPLWFTPDEAAELTALGDGAKAAFDASPEGRQLADWRRQRDDEQRADRARTAALQTPEGAALAAERARLATAAAAILDVDEQQRARAHDDEGGDPGAYYREQQPRNEAEYERAVQALAAFDAEHPEIVAALEAEKTAERRRFLDAD
jgi:hypothetical protein